MDEMLDHGVQPVQKKSQCNAERHFGFPVHAFTKDDGDFAYAQGPAGAHHCLENNLEPAGLGREFQQSRTTDREEAAHGIVQASERIGEQRTCSRHNAPPYWPAGIVPSKSP